MIRQGDRNAVDATITTVERVGLVKSSTLH